MAGQTCNFSELPCGGSGAPTVDRNVLHPLVSMSDFFTIQDKVGDVAEWELFPQESLGWGKFSGAAGVLLQVDRYPLASDCKTCGDMCLEKLYDVDWCGHHHHHDGNNGTNSTNMYYYVLLCANNNDNKQIMNNNDDNANHNDHHDYFHLHRKDETRIHILDNSHLINI